MVKLNANVQTTVQIAGWPAVPIGYLLTKPPLISVESFLKDRPPQPVEIPEQESEIRWGKASQFQYDASEPDYSQATNTTVINSSDDNDDENSEDDDGLREMLIEFPEVARETEEIRVSNPNDATMYVDIERIKTITFEAPPTGERGDIRQFWKFILNWGDDS